MAISCTTEDIEDRDIALLKVEGELDWDARPAFRQAVADVLAGKRRKIVLDLSKIRRMSSVYIGTLIDFGTRAAEAEKTLSVILMPRMATVANEAGLGKVVSVISVEA